MTIPEFLKAFADKVRVERPTVDLIQKNMIRLNASMCPIEYVAGVDGAWAEAGPKLGLSEIDVTKIVNAVDNTSTYTAEDPMGLSYHRILVGLDLELRHSLLGAAGLDCCK